MKTLKQLLDETVKKDRYGDIYSDTDEIIKSVKKWLIALKNSEIPEPCDYGNCEVNKATYDRIIAQLNENKETVSKP